MKGAEDARASVGLSADGKLVEVFVSPSGARTTVVTFPSGGACIIGHGSDWQSVPVIASGRAS